MTLEEAYNEMMKLMPLKEDECDVTAASTIEEDKELLSRL